MSQMPVTCRKLSTPWNEEAREKYEKPVLGEAKKRFSWIDYRSPVAVKYRRAISDFTAFCREHPAPKGQPEATWAIAKGNLDLGGPSYVAGNAVCGAFDLAKSNPNWMYGQPEMSWDVVRKAVMPMPPMLAPNKNIHFSASPYGLCDVVSFACDNVTAEHLLKNYKVLMFAEVQGVDMEDTQNGISLTAVKSGDETDGVLEYAKEDMGFNHKVGKNKFGGNVAFADGHVETVVMPTKMKIRDLTRYLCQGYDVPHDGSSYKPSDEDK